MIFLQHKLEDADQRTQVSDLIFSQRYGKRSFNLDIPQRTPCMEALYAGEPFDEINQTDESVITILARYSDIQENFPDELLSKPLPYFLDWLIENVHLVEITAYSDQDAYTIFETMNDRGLSLAPADMLKGYRSRSHVFLLADHLVHALVQVVGKGFFRMFEQSITLTGLAWGHRGWQIPYTRI